jgi:hypothetical protein
MKHFYPDATFAKRFQQPYTLHASADELHLGQYIFTRYRGSENDMCQLAGLLSEQWGHARLIGKIVHKLVQDDQPGDHRLYIFIRTLIDTFNTCSLQEPYTAPFYNKINQVLRSLLMLVSAYRRQVQFPVCKKLMARVTAGNGQSSLPDSDDVDGVQLIMEQYLREIQCYYDDLQILLEEEISLKGGCGCISQVERQFQMLSDLLEGSMLRSGTTHAMLDILKTEIMTTEMQRIGN